jgi:predicted nucleic acid-binding protein
MKPRFADAFYYLAMVNPRDEAHARVKARASSMSGPIVTTVWVLTEVGDALAAPPSRAVFQDLMNDLWADDETEIVPASDALFRRGVALFARRPDKGWSLTDCVSFVVMTDRGADRRPPLRGGGVPGAAEGRVGRSKREGPRRGAPGAFG